MPILDKYDRSYTRKWCVCFRMGRDILDSDRPKGSPLDLDKDLSF